MALPSIDNFELSLRQLKAAEQSWGEVFWCIRNQRPLQTEVEATDPTSISAHKKIVLESGLLPVLEVWDIYYTDCMDAAAKNLGVQAWEIIEFIDHLRERLNLTESDFVIRQQVSDGYGAQKTSHRDQEDTARIDVHGDGMGGALPSSPLAPTNAISPELSSDQQILLNSNATRPNEPLPQMISNNVKRLRAQQSSHLGNSSLSPNGREIKRDPKPWLITLSIIGFFIIFGAISSQQRRESEANINGVSQAHGEKDATAEMPPNSQSQYSAESEAESLNGTWEGHYVCDGQKRKLELVLESSQEKGTRAIFRFSRDPGNHSDNLAPGSFLMTGAYAHSGLRGRGQTGELELTGSSWIQQPTGYGMLNMRGSVNLADRLISGTILNPNCAGFELRFLGSSGLEQFDQPAASTSAGRISFHNQCRLPLRVAISYRTLSGAWATEGWWDIRPNHTTYLDVNNGPLRIGAPTVQYYAEITERPHLNYSWNGSIRTQFAGRQLNMREEVLSVNSEGSYVLSLNCNNI